MTIALLLGGTSSERHVSMASGRGMAEAFQSRGHEVILFDPARGRDARISFEDLQLPTTIAPTPEELAAFSNNAVLEALMTIPDSVDVVALALHGSPGEDGLVQSVLELRGLPYTGSGPLASALALDKAMSKRMLEHADVQTPLWFLEPSGVEAGASIAEQAEQVTGYPVVVKPNVGGSTVGLTIVESEEGLAEAFALAGRYSPSVLFEEFIEGRELTVAVLGEETLPVVEIRPKSGIYDYANKYTAGRTEYFCPADLSRAVEEEVRDLALRAHEALGCAGYSRVDFRLDPDGGLWCLEVNTLPGMTATSLVPKAAAAAGIDYGMLCERIVELGLKRGARVGEAE